MHPFQREGWIYIQGKIIQYKRNQRRRQCWDMSPPLKPSEQSRERERSLPKTENDTLLPQEKLATLWNKTGFSCLAPRRKCGIAARDPESEDTEKEPISPRRIPSPL
jgi:hypothetical protein